MSSKLYIRIKPNPEEWDWVLSSKLRDILSSRFGDEISSKDSTVIPYLEGILDMSDKEDLQSLEDIINCLAHGNSLELKIGC